MKHEYYSCDVCQSSEKPVTLRKMQVIFTTEQDEGKSVKPYFENKEVDLCDSCYKKALQGQYLFADGAMGYNKFYFRSN